MNIGDWATDGQNTNFGKKINIMLFFMLFMMKPVSVSRLILFFFLFFLLNDEHLKCVCMVCVLVVYLFIRLNYGMLCLT